MDIRRIDGNPLVAGGADAETHIVQQGESLEDIAKQHGISNDELIKHNPQIQDASQLTQGMALQIPGRKAPVITGFPSRDSYETAPEKSAIDKMMDGPNYDTRTVGTHNPSHFDEFRNQNDGGDVSWGDPHVSMDPNAAPLSGKKTKEEE